MRSMSCGSLLMSPRVRNSTLVVPSGCGATVAITVMGPRAPVIRPVAGFASLTLTP